MIRKIAIAGLMVTGFASAEVTLYTVSNAQESAAVSPYSFGNVAQGDTKTVRFRMRNNSATAAVQVTVLGATGLGFALNGQPPIPLVLAPGAAQDFNVMFAAGSASSYSGNLQVNSVSITLLATTSPAPTLTVFPACSETPSSAGAAFFGTVDFGRVPAGTTATCDFVLTNSSTPSETVSNFTLTGSGFQGPIGLVPPVTLSTQESAHFSINFSAAQAGLYTGTLTIASRVYKLTVAVFPPPLDAPTMSFDTTLINSSEQHTLSMRLRSAATLDASGLVSMSFVPDSPVIADDPAILFVATGGRALPFSVKAGSSQVSIGGAAGAVFQTGTSAGRIRFTVSGVAQGLNGSDVTELRIPASTLKVASATLTHRLGDLDLKITGFDNTYTAGSMSFTFYDTGGKAISPGTIQADFTGSFNSYFKTSAWGSSFLLGITFPVSGSQASIASVDVTMTNAAGSATISKLALQ